MKKSITVSLFIVGTLFLSCKKEDHSIRFLNNYTIAVQNIVAGETELGTVAAGQSSEYKSIPTGEFSISGTTATGFIQGSGTISGKGEHKWTISLGSDKNISLIQDN